MYHTHTDKQSDRQTGAHTDRRADRQTNLFEEVNASIGPSLQQSPFHLDAAENTMIQGEHEERIKMSVQL